MTYLEKAAEMYRRANGGREPSAELIAAWRKRFGCFVNQPAQPFGAPCAGRDELHKEQRRG